jgi:hypothetical protein
MGRPQVKGRKSSQTGDDRMQAACAPHLIALLAKEAMRNTG